MHLNSMSFHFIALFPNNCRIFIRERLIGSSLFYDIDPDMEALYTVFTLRNSYQNKEGHHTVWNKGDLNRFIKLRLRFLSL